MLLGVFTIAGNLFLIPIYGVLGAAIATFTSSVVFNLLKYGYIKYKLKMSPFSDKTLLLIFISILIYLIIAFIPEIKNHYLSIFIKGASIFIIFVPTVFFMKISEDFNKILMAFIQRLLKIVKI